MIGLDVLETRIIENILVGSAHSVLMKEMGLSEVSRLWDERERNWPYRASLLRYNPCF